MIQFDREKKDVNSYAVANNLRKSTSSQLSTEAASYPGVFQLFKEGRLKGGRSKTRKAQISHNENYILFNNEKKKIYVKSGAEAPLYCAESGGKFTHNKITYEAYIPKSKFLADCIHTAEEIMNEQELEFGAGVYSHVKSKDKEDFGDSDARNIHLANKYAENHDANPGVGEAFAIVATKILARRWPFHAAAVVAKDNSDAVTIEVTAGHEDAEKRDQTGVFHMYQSGDARNSFHAVISEYFDGQEPKTIVLQK